MRRERYKLILTKSQVNKLYNLVKETKASKVPIEVRRQLLDLYFHANNIVVNGGGA
jgi:tmRNA-binding protein